MTDLLERDEALATLDASARAAAEGHGRTVLVSGEAGIGKTTLLERFGAGLALGRLLWGGCESLATPRPLGPLHDVAAQAGARLRSLVATAHDRAALFDAVLDELAAAPSPTVLVFEDMHWADDATLDLVKFVGRRVRRLPALLVLSYRDDDSERKVPSDASSCRSSPTCSGRRPTTSRAASSAGCCWPKARRCATATSSRARQSRNRSSRRARSSCMAACSRR